jgi:hypothetical protein
MLSAKDKYIRENLFKVAREYAESGKYQSWISIEFAIRIDYNYPQARARLDNRHIKAELDERCKKHYKKPK